MTDTKSSTYSHADVLRLVMEVTHMLRNSPRAVFNIDPVLAALKPFQPDPEDELIGAMAITIQQEAATGRAAYHDMARAALAVIKERDLLKTPRKEATL